MEEAPEDSCLFKPSLFLPQEEGTAMLASPLGTTFPRMQQHYDYGARQINIAIG